MQYATLLTRLCRSKIAQVFSLKQPHPINVTLSVTNRCNSFCKTCDIWEVYIKDKNKFQEELTLQEIEKIFQSMGETYFFNISGGCPFLRSDLKEIIILATTLLNPSIIHIPTNCLAPRKILRMTKSILEWLKYNKPEVKLTIKPSFDGIGETHDEIRGVKGNYEKLLTTYHGLKKLKLNYPNFEVGLGTVISKMNFNHIDEIIKKVEELKPDSYINEIAENREEMFNITSDIMPKSKEYASVIEKFERYYSYLKKDKRSFKVLLRTIYYREVISYLEGKKERLTCYAGISNCHIDPYGNLWACCILGNSKPLGNLRDTDYIFQTAWHSKQAKEVLKSIKNKECSCPLANQFYSNVLLDGRGVLKIIKQAFKR